MSRITLEDLQSEMIFLSSITSLGKLEKNVSFVAGLLGTFQIYGLM